MFGGELLNVPVKVLLAQVMERAVISALQQSPEGLYAVCASQHINRIRYGSLLPAVAHVRVIA